MTWCLNHPDQLQKMGQRSREIIDQVHNIDAYMNEMLAGITMAHHLRSGHRTNQSIDGEKS